ncbi:MAG: chitobiase/beta-hexosaminidase C-terminal domain-containing protein, partial [Bacteroidetes bacterium]|nr:chitobiase/beta-hexosaminidase C-terminal domain-containing protein [Bacteroidota bacterium]
VTLRSATPDVKIYYTTDGSTPAFVDANEYKKPFRITNGMTIKAIAKRYSFDNSGMAELTYNTESSK